MGEMFGTLAKHYHEGGFMMHPILVSLFVAIGLIAAWGASTLSSLGLDRFARWAPYASAAIMLLIGLVVVAQGVSALKLV